jgi:hypothetical protein
MNILTDALPETVACNTTEYRIRSDFKDCLRIMLAFEDNTLTGQEKQIILLNALYSVVPADISEAIKAANWFLNGGRDSDEESDGLRLFSFTTDANLIYAAFRQTHGIDLATAELHWWQFLALFMDLGQDTTFCQLVALRKRIKTGKATKEERAAASAMGSMFDVEDIDTRTLAQKDAERRFFELVKLGEQKRNGNTV